jgi:hypothetical protein
MRPLFKLSVTLLLALGCRPGLALCPHADCASAHAAAPRAARTAADDKAQDGKAQDARAASDERHDSHAGNSASHAGNDDDALQTAHVGKDDNARRTTHDGNPGLGSPGHCATSRARAERAAPSHVPASHVPASHVSSQDDANSTDGSPSHSASDLHDDARAIAPESGCGHCARDGGGSSSSSASRHAAQTSRDTRGEVAHACDAHAAAATTSFRQPAPAPTQHAPPRHVRTHLLNSVLLI